MTTERKKLAFEKFFSTYFSNFGKFTLLNMIFALPLALSFGICFLLCRFLLPQEAAMVVLPFTLVLASPFYSGVIVAGKKIYYDELSDSIFSEYVRAVKENFKAFILHGFVAYVAFVGCYFGFVIYALLAKVSPIFYAMIVVSVIIALFLLFLLYGVSMMSSFFDLKLKDVYRNSLLMTFGEIKGNFIATLGIFAFLAILSIPLAFFFNLTSVWGENVSLVVIYAYLAAIFIFLIPSGVSTIITASVYPDLKRVISGEAKANMEAARKESGEDSSEDIYTAQESAKPAFTKSDIPNLEKNPDEYVFYNGRMIKKSAIIEELRESEEN